ncbi:MAG TPA: hypothetical protein VM869_22940 [Enhygromyxa sp.]|nr:hypothetical protein [Enhygromyxa sp.]
MRSTVARLASVLSLLGLTASACSEPDTGSDGPIQCVAGTLCPEGLVCVQGFCLNAGMGDDETGDGDGDPTTGDGDGDPTTGDGDGDDDPSTGDGDGDGDPTTGDGDGDPTTGDGDGDPTTGDGDGDPTTGDGDGDPTTGDGDGDGDPWGGDPTPANLWPMVVGATWTYQVAPGTGCNGGNTTTWAITGMEQHLGYLSWARTTCGVEQSHYRITNGDLYVSYLNNPWFLLLKAPVVDGATWVDTGNTLHEWVYEGMYDTPAGTFDACWTNDYASASTFCQGVGLVDSSSPGPLVSYSIP